MLFEKARTRRMRQARIACSAISFSRRRGPSLYFIRVWLSEVDACLRALLDDEPATVPEWRVLLLFLAGRLAMRQANNAQALRSFRACMSEDATRFSSLLATKTIEAAYWAGLLCARNGPTAMPLENRGHVASEIACGIAAEAESALAI